MWGRGERRHVRVQISTACGEIISRLDWRNRGREGPWEMELGRSKHKSTLPCRLRGFIAGFGLWYKT